MRITGGKYKNRRIIVQDDGIKAAFKPTTDKLRQAIFNIIASHPDLPYDFLMSANVLDLCCGSGSFGLEALSRGAKAATFIDISQSSLEICRKNIIALDELDAAQCILSNISDLKKAPSSYEVIFLDPPYRNTTLILKALFALVAGGWVAYDNFIVVEHCATEHIPLQLLENFKLLMTRTYGGSAITILRLVTPLTTGN